MIAAGAAYVTGFLIDPLTKRWAKLFRSKDSTAAGFESFLTTCPTFKVNFTAHDWRILINNVRFKSRETADRSERFNALNIMLRNVGFGLLLLAVVYVAYFMIVAANLWNLVLAAACLGLSMLAERESAKYSRWFYTSIFQAAAALSLDGYRWVEPLVAAEPPAPLPIPAQMKPADEDQESG